MDDRKERLSKLPGNDELVSMYSLTAKMSIERFKGVKYANYIRENTSIYIKDINYYLVYKNKRFIVMLGSEVNNELENKLIDELDIYFAISVDNEQNVTSESIQAQINKSTLFSGRWNTL